MRISKLELYGFKSFPDRTSLNFGDGISCVVGPNGSGKSNVVDALKWCIGEQSARSLRGAEMSDVIFAGSSDRKPVGFAEVQLTLRATETPFPGEYSPLAEIQVGRRLHRSGASEYLLNQVKCRRKDIVNLFMDSGMGNHLYSFIEQGQVDKMVSASAAERRTLIDEAAGITRYKVRRAEASSRLVATATQLDRAADVADEMGKRLAILESQVLAAAKFRRVRALIRLDEILLALVAYAHGVGDRRALMQRQREAAGGEAAARRELARRETDIEERQTELVTAETVSTEARDQVAELDARRRALSTKAELTDKRLGEIAQEEQQALEEVQRGESDVEEERESVSLRKEALEEAEREVELQRASLEAAVGVVKVSGEQQSAEQRALRALEEQLVKARERVSRSSALLESDVRARDALPEKEDRAKRAVAMAQARLEEAQKESERLAEERPGRQEAVDRAVAAVAEACTAETHAQAVVKECQARAQQARRSVDAAERGMGRAVEQACGIESRGASEAARALEEARRGKRKAMEAQAAGSEAVSVRAKLVARAGAVRKRAERWREAAAQRARAEAARGLASAEGVAAAARQEAADRLSAATEQARAAAQAQLSEVVSRVEVEVGAREVEVGSARESLASCQGAADEASQGHRAARERLAEGNSRELELRARSSSEVPGAHSAAEVLGESAESLVKIAGERLLLPVVSAADVEKLRAEKRQEPLTVLLGGEGLADRLGRVEEAEGALTPGSLPRVYDAGSVRVEPDGVVQLSGELSAAEALVARRKAWRAASSALPELQAEVERCESMVGAARSALAAAQQEVKGAESALRAARESGARATKEARAKGEQERQQAVSAARKVHDAAVAAAESVAREARRVSNEEVEQVLAGLDEQVSEAREAVLTELEAEAERAVEAATVRLAEQVAVATEAVRVAEDAEQAAVAVLAARRADVRERGERWVAAERSAAEARRVAVEGAQVELRGAQRGLDEARAGQREAAAAQKALVERIGLASQRVREREEACEQAASEVEALAAERSRLVAAVEQGQRELEEAAAQLDEVSKAHREQGELSTEASEQLRMAEASRAKREAAVEVARERCGASKRALEDAGKRQAAAEERVARAKERVGRAVEQRAVAKAEVGGASEELVQLRDAHAGEWERLQSVRARVVELKEALEGARNELKRVRERRELAAAELAEAEEALRAVRGVVDTAKQEMEERYQVSLPAFLDRIRRGLHVTLEVKESVAQGLVVPGGKVAGVDPVRLDQQALDDHVAVEAAKTRLEVHRKRIARMGQVNLAAMEEFEELSDRHGELVTQRDDLEASIRSIKSAIAKMNKLCRERFREAFDEVNETLQESYPELVGGGSARLSLTDENDLLEAGVEFFVQPPGKRLQNLTLLSGGEKAMAAIALMIALFKVKPSPFCVLDEVDAPLDEANGSRFNDMLRELSKSSQFVVITHNRKTMECADTLYGITMARPGVSRLVSVRV